MYERCLAIRVPIHFVCRASCDHKPLGLWLIVSHAQSQLAYLICIVSIRASIVITCVCIKHVFILCPNVVTVFFIKCTTTMAPMKKRAEKESGKKKEVITVEVKNGSAL
jgi:hypothetical protein